MTYLDDKLLVTLKQIFSSMLGIQYDEVKLSYSDLNTKDNFILSPKQWICLFRYFDSDLEITKQFIKDSTYVDISDKIRLALNTRREVYILPDEDWGDRG